jgi:hypothetical protein
VQFGINPASSSEIQTRTPQALVDNFNNQSSLLTKGIINIWGDWNKRGLDQENIISEIRYDASNQKLALVFKNGNKLTVWNPNNIHETTTYLKIIHAKKVLWEWNSQFAMTYQKDSATISRHTNSKWQLDPLDVDFTKPALMIKY